MNDSDAEVGFGCLTVLVFAILFLFVVGKRCSCSCGQDQQAIEALDAKINTVSSNLVELKNYLDTAHGQIVKSNSQVNSK